MLGAIMEGNHESPERKTMQSRKVQAYIVQLDRTWNTTIF
jgi:hypothetical protein